MNKLLLTSILSIFIVGCVNVDFKLTTPISSCETKQDLEQEEINQFDEIGRRYINYINNEDSISLEKELSSVSKTLPSLKEIKELMTYIKQKYGALSDEKLTSVFNVKTNKITSVICTDDLSDKRNNYIVKTAPDLNNFVVIIHEVKTQGGKINFINEIVKEEGIWKSRAFMFQMAELNGKNADDFISIGDFQLDKNNYRNALFYYSLGQRLILNNALIKSEYFDVINKQISSIISENKIDLPTYQNPTEWIMDSGNIYTIYKIAPNVTKTEIGLQINYLTKNLEDIDKLKTESEEIANYVKINFPEYREIFAGLIITSIEQIPEATEAMKSYNNIYEFD